MHAIWQYTQNFALFQNNFISIETNFRKHNCWYKITHNDINKIVYSGFVEICIKYQIFTLHYSGLNVLQILYKTTFPNSFSVVFLFQESTKNLINYHWSSIVSANFLLWNWFWLKIRHFKLQIQYSCQPPHCYILEQIVIILITNQKQILTVEWISSSEIGFDT